MKYKGQATEITIPEKLNGYDVTKIICFDNYKLITVNIPASIKEIYTTGLYYGSSDGKWYYENINVDSNNNTYCSIDGVLFSKDMKRLVCYPSNKQWETYSIPEGVETIQANAFWYNENIKKIVTPVTMTSIPYYSICGLKFLENIEIAENVQEISTTTTLMNCVNIKNIEVDKNNNYYSSKQGVLFNKDGTILLKYPDGKDKTYKIPEGTEILEREAFSDMKYLDIPEGIKEISSDALSRGRFLQGIRIPNSVNYIDSLTFEESENLIIYCNKDSYAEKYAIENNILVKSWNEYSPKLEITTIKFEDINLYNEIVNSDVKILNKDDNNLSIQMDSLDVLYVDELNIESAGIKNLKGIEKFSNLKYIWASHNQINDISVISNLSKLETIDFEYNEIEDISAVQNLKNLNTVYLGFNFKIRNIEPLQNLTNLKSVDLTSNLISDISKITKLTNLRELYLGVNSISNIDNIGNLTNLKILVLSNNKIQDISELAKMIQLEELFLGQKTSTPRYIIESVINHTIGNNIEDISPLTELIKLKTLGIDYNNISNLDAIKHINLSNLYAQAQELKMQIPVKGTDIIEIDLPKVFIEAKDENSIVYTDKDFKFVNCELNQDGTKLVVNPLNIFNDVSIEIDGGKLNGTKLTIIEGLTMISNLYNIKDDTIKNIKERTTFEEFQKNIITNSTNIKLLDKNNQEMEKNAQIGTGMKLKITDGSMEQIYTLIVTGDLTGEGEMTDVDLLKMARYKAGLDNNLNGVYLEAANIFQDNYKADDKDLLKMVRILVGLDNL